MNIRPLRYEENGDIISYRDESIDLITILLVQILIGFNSHEYERTRAKTKHITKKSKKLLLKILINNFLIFAQKTKKSKTNKKIKIIQAKRK